LPITVQSGTTWNGVVQGRIGSPTNTEYDGSGDYKIRLRRYTSKGGNTASEANNSAVSIAINLPTPTPTSIPTNTPTPILIPTDTPLNIPTTVKSTNTPIPKSTATPTPKPKPLTSAKLIATSNAVLGESSESSKIQSPTVKSKEVKTFSASVNNWVSKILILIGIVFLVACAIVFSYPYIVRFKNKNAHE